MIINPQDKIYVSTAIQEILDPKFEITKQYLEVNELELENGLPKVVRIGKNYYPDLVAVYFAIQDERYFLEVHLTKKPKAEVNFVDVESGHRVYLTATSEALTFQELSSFLPFQKLTGWSVGDKRNNGIEYTFSRLNYEPIKNEAYGLDEKLELLLNDLETASNDIIALTRHVDTQIIVCRHQYISANAGIGFGIETIKRLEKLNLGIDIDTYIVGNEIKDI